MARRFEGTRRLDEFIAEPELLPTLEVVRNEHWREPTSPPQTDDGPRSARGP